MDETTHDALVGLPPSAKLVYKTLEYEGPLTQGQLASESLLPARTVRYALSTLEEAELVTEELFLQDARKRLYSLLSEESTHSGGVAGVTAVNW